MGRLSFSATLSTCELRPHDPSAHQHGQVSYPQQCTIPLHCPSLKVKHLTFIWVQLHLPFLRPNLPLVYIALCSLPVFYTLHNSTNLAISCKLTNPSTYIFIANQSARRESNNGSSGPRAGCRAKPQSRLRYSVQTRASQRDVPHPHVARLGRPVQGSEITSTAGGWFLL